MSKPWKRCKALIKLVSQVNAAYPGRDTSSDGSIGDADHASRSSDHNPWIIDPADNVGVVTAQDIDEDLNSATHSIEAIVTAIRKSRDPRVKYIIYEGRITKKGSDLQEWEAYHGTNSHSHHAHISVKQEKKYWNDDAAWSIGSAAEAPAEEPTVNESADKTPNPSEKPANDQAEPPIHVVVAGDNLWTLGSKCQLSVAEIMHLNGLKSDKIFVGQKLKIK